LFLCSVIKDVAFKKILGEKILCLFVSIKILS
jgi:hypothetical protein